MAIGRKPVDPSLPHEANRDSDLLDQEHICASFNSKWGHMKSLVNCNEHEIWHISMNCIAQRGVSLLGWKKSPSDVLGQMGLWAWTTTLFKIEADAAKIAQSCGERAQKAGFNVLSNSFSGAHLPLHPLVWRDLLFLNQFTRLAYDSACSWGPTLLHRHLSMHRKQFPIPELPGRKSRTGPDNVSWPAAAGEFQIIKTQTACNLFG